MYNFLDRIIIYVADSGLSGTVYNYINTASFIAALLFGIFNRKKFNMSFLLAILFVFANDYFMGYVNQFILWAGTGFTSFGERNMAVSFAFIPILALLLSFILRKDYGNVLDFLAFPPMVAHAVCRFACIFPGCCYGYECSFGIYNVSLSKKLFPVQLLESALTIVIIIILMAVFKKQNSVSRGFLMPLMLIMYGTARFFTEFLHNNEKLFIGISYVAYNCLFMVIVGILLLFILKRRNNLRRKPYVSQKT